MKKQLDNRELLKLYFWTLSYFRPFMLSTCFYVFSGGVMIWGELMIPRRMGYLIDYVLPLENKSNLMTQMLFLCGIAILILLSKAIFNFLELIISNKIVKNQQKDLMMKLHDLGFSYYEKVPTGQIISIFENSVKEVQQTYTFLFPHFIYSLVQFAVPSIILISSEPIFFLTAMIGNVLYVFINRYANKKIHYYLGKETQAAHKSQQNLYDAIVAASELKIMGSQEWFVKKTMEAFDCYRIPRMWSIFWRHFRYTTVGLTLTLSIVLFYVYGLDLVKSGELLLGEFIGYSFLMGLLSRGFSVFFYIVPAQYHALNYAKDLYEYMHLEPDVKEQANCNTVDIKEFDIEFENVSFSYAADQQVISSLSFKIPAGKRTAIVGESGCGKSTILKLIGRFYDVKEGRITVGGYDIKNHKLKELRKHFGYVFQDTYLFNMSISDNIKFGSKTTTDEQVIEAAKLASAHDFIMETSESYNTMVGERGVLLSGGQKQRISIARMMLKNPEIIMLDEATSALDNVTESEIKLSFDKLSKGKTTVAVAHRLSTIIDYDSIIVLDEGMIVEQGTYEELMMNRSHFYSLVMRGAEDAC
ncbi:MAG: ABC transporter ATP-binding protein [Clostridiales bacterium]|nr:ABC transporter ATP-binding protein [Clostridiales bacterium]